MMQGNDSRLVRAARRTIRAEATLVVVIVVITSWSIYALYKLSAGAPESVSGLFREQRRPTPSGHKGALTFNDSDLKTTAGQMPETSEPQPARWSSSDYANQRSHILRDLLSRGHFDHVAAVHRLPDQDLAQHLESERNKWPSTLAKLERQIQQRRLLNALAAWPLGDRGQKSFARDEVQYPSSSKADPSDLHSNIGRRRVLTEDVNDRQAAESNRDPAESVVSSNPDSGELTRPQAPRLKANESLTPADEAPDQEPADSSTDEPPSSSHDGSDGQPADETEQPEEESASETGQTIDEEVDRMTQPSGVVAKQDRQSPDMKDMVQFDELLDLSGPSSWSTETITRTPEALGHSTGPHEAQTEHTETMDIDIKEPSGMPVGEKLEDFRSKSVRWELKKLDAAAKNHTDTPSDHGESKFSTSLERPKRSVHVLRAPYEIDGFLGMLDFESLSGRPPISAGTYLDESRTYGGPIDSKSGSSAVGSDTIPSASEYHLTTNDTALQELLTKKQLLDALGQSQLPAPQLGNQTSGSSSAPSPAGSTQYSVDHGLLLSQLADKEHRSLSSKKKHAKRERVKAKKKMTVASKKGGHKDKEHGHEEKKFLKEKRFKGAKKGKKVAKGKGGQGGKKGKKLYKDKGFKKKGFKNVYHKEEFGQKKSYFDEFRDKDFKKKWKKFDDKYNYAQMKKWQAKDVKGAKKLKDQGKKFKKYDKSKWKKKYHKDSKDHSESSKKEKKTDEFE